MELTTQVQKGYKVGAQTITLTTGQHFKMETTPNGEELLDFIADKDYVINVTFQATADEEEE